MLLKGDKMEDYDLLLTDRLGVIKDTINKYGEDKFYISFSGGKDSTILHYLVDLALPNNKIPRVFINTGIEYNDIVKFVNDLASKDNRFVILKPTQNIKNVLETYGYPFKSKEHSLYVATYQSMGEKSKTYQRYLYPDENRKKYKCIDLLRYQFTKDFNLRVSDKCCFKLKEEPVRFYEKETNRKIAILGIMKEERGRRSNAKCFVKDKHFNPLVVLTKGWEDWFIEKYNIQLCKLYYPPFNFKRTGCKGCPYNLNLQKDLETLKEQLPNEYKQCCFIWKPVYDEYKRIGYRLKDNEKELKEKR